VRVPLAPTALALTVKFAQWASIPTDLDYSAATSVQHSATLLKLTPNQLRNACASMVCAAMCRTHCFSCLRAFLRISLDASTFVGPAQRQVHDSRQGRYAAEFAQFPGYYQITEESVCSPCMDGTFKNSLGNHPCQQVRQTRARARGHARTHTRC
jgi:hypothetical protein